jgi:hypothetical protein
MTTVATCGALAMTSPALVGRSTRMDVLTSIYTTCEVPSALFGMRR